MKLGATWAQIYGRGVMVECGLDTRIKEWNIVCLYLVHAAG